MWLKVTAAIDSRQVVFKRFQGESIALYDVRLAVSWKTNWEGPSFLFNFFRFLLLSLSDLSNRICFQYLEGMYIVRGRATRLVFGLSVLLSRSSWTGAFNIAADPDLRHDGQRLPTLQLCCRQLLKSYSGYRGAIDWRGLHTAGLPCIYHEVLNIYWSLR